MYLKSQVTSNTFKRPFRQVNLIYNAIRLEFLQLLGETQNKRTFFLTFRGRQELRIQTFNAPSTCSKLNRTSELRERTQQ